MKPERRVNNDIYRGQLTFKELGRRLHFQESDHLETSYMGYARRQVG